MKNIFFGSTLTDLNLCGAHGTPAWKTDPQYYKMAAAPDLTKNIATVNITGSQSGN